MLNWWPFLVANSYRLSVPTIYVQNSVSFTNSFSRVIFINSLSPIFFYKLNITNSFSRINLQIRKSSKKFVRIRTTSFWFVFAKSVLYCERPVLYVVIINAFLLPQSFNRLCKLGQVSHCNLCLLWARSKTRSSRKTRKPRRISFPRFSTPSFPFCTIPKTEKSKLKTSEICSEVVSSNSEVLWSNSEVFNSDFSILHYTQNGKLGDENLGVFSNAV